jgi:hypothetical protein
MHDALVLNKENENRRKQIFGQIVSTNTALLSKNPSSSVFATLTTVDNCHKNKYVDLSVQSSMEGARR